jgi:hypothetical protein
MGLTIDGIDMAVTGFSTNISLIPRNGDKTLG